MTTDPDETEDRPNPDRVYKDENPKHLEARKLRRKNEDKIETAKFLCAWVEDHFEVAG